MKKLIGTVAVAAVLATAAFAEITFGSWLRVVAAPVAGDGDDIYSGMTNSWGWGARVARVDIRGQSEDERAGFSMQIFNDSTGGIAAGDEAALWVKPWDWLKVSLGHYDYTKFRGDLCFGSWNWIRPANWIFEDEGLTFDKLGAKDGMHFEITPVEGLLIMWNLPISGQIASWDKAYKMLEGSDAAVKYTIGDVGTIKAGWGGSTARKGDDYRNYGAVNVAFDLTAVENLYVTIGARFNIADGDYRDAYPEAIKKDDGTITGYNDFGFIKVAVGASYQILDNLGIAANFGVQTYENYDPSFQFGVGVNVGLTDALTLNADFRGLIPGGYDKNGIKYDPDPQFSFLVGLQYACSSNGYVGIGFQGTTGGCGFLGNLKHDDDFAWAVPIAVSVWF